MGYTALEEMRKKNRIRYGIDAPRIPAMAETRLLQDKTEAPVDSLEREAVSFIRELCEALLFDKTKERAELEDSDGTSVGKSQIPFNMERDIDRLCLETAVHRFLETGIAQDAFDVYFCYLEMFIGSYSHSRRMIETLAEFESNASTLLMKHRDHYSHSVYVFLIGLAIYHSNPDFRRQYQEFYGLKGEAQKAAHHFIRFWGLSSLFHDIGYPFEIPFEQVKSYFGKENKSVPYVAYHNMEHYVKIDVQPDNREDWDGLLLGGGGFVPSGLNEVLAHNIAYRLEKSYRDNEEFERYQRSHPDRSYPDYLSEDVLGRKASAPEAFGSFMDHAYFSAVVLFKQLLSVVGLPAMAKDASGYMDALTAILLHNSLYKFSITNYRSACNDGHEFDMSLHPLAFLLMLCDELQCWDRTSYGQNSRSEVHAMGCELSFDPDGIRATYVFDRQLREKARAKGTKGTYRKLTEPAGDRPVFLADIERILRVNRPGTMKLSVGTTFAPNNRLRRQYLSDSSFIHLYHFAVALNARYFFAERAGGDTGIREESAQEDVLERMFEDRSLEYKLSNINQAKAFAGHMEAIGCFYTDRPVAYELVTAFTPEDMEKIGPLEHLRWLRERASMGWIYGKKQPVEIREQTRTHGLMTGPEVEIGPDTARIHYAELPEAEKNKDVEPMNSMLKLLERYDGLRIYRR